MIDIPDGLRAVTALREGEAGHEWLNRLPGLVAAACSRWNCTIDGTPTHGQVAGVVPVQHRRGPAVLKISFPHPGNLGEAAALRTFAGHGAVELFEADDTGLELVLERCRPLTLAAHTATIEDYPVEEAIEVAGDIARRLAVQPLPGITRLADTTPG
jgi:streptomycin 6-kinase